ncbi:MAG TPA: carboxypeptidase regulatory-like domain-containing protein [Oscillatoriaceae cyanobacterium]
MKFRANHKMTRHIALASGLVMLFAGCQLSTPTQQPQVEHNVGNNPTSTTTGNGQSNVPTPQNQSNATVTGTVTDTNGAPVAGVQINTYDGFTTTTDANGKYTLPAIGQDELRVDFSKDGFIPRQVLTGLDAGQTASQDITLLPLDKTVATVNAKNGGSVTSSDGNSVLEIPPGALTGDTKVNVTWMDPMPSAQFPTDYGQLPGPPVTKTMPDGSAAGDVQMLSPLGFATVNLNGGQLAPGAQATLKMKVDPAALQAAGSSIDFNNPDTLQQPCYEYDRASGLWVNPATSKLEKDADGTVWFVYTLHGQDAPAHLKVLNHISGQKTIYWTTQEARTGSYTTTVSVGGYTKTVTNYYTYYVTVSHSKQVNLYGKHFDGQIVERSSNSAYNGKGINGATVDHQADFYGMTRSSTDGGGNYDIPMWYQSSGVNVSGSTWRGASSTGGGLNETIPTDGNVTADIKGGSLDYKATNSNLSNGSWSGSVNKVASRDSDVTLEKPASPLYIAGNPTLSGKVPVKGTLAFGTIKVVKDVSGQVTEQVTGTDNIAGGSVSLVSGASTSTLSKNGDGLDGTTITKFTDAVTGATSATTAGGGNFKFTIYGNEAAPTVNANYKNYVNADGPGSPYHIVLNTDSTETLTLGNEFGADEAGKTATLTYSVDGATYAKTVTLDASGKITLVFAHDKSDDKLGFKLLKVETPDMISNGTLPSATLVPHGSSAGTVPMVFKDNAVKYHT